MSSTKEAVAPPTNAYVDAFRRLGELSDSQIQMLRLHYHAPERTVTARELALATGYTHHSVANALYGQLGRRIGEALNFKPTKEHVGALVTFNKPDGKWRWIMRPQVAEALEKLDWVDTPHLLLPEEIAAKTSLKEGSIIHVAANVYERNPDARRVCVESYGYNCAACGFNFGKIYGDIGEGFIHVHHLKPLSEIGGEYIVDPIKDLRPVCPNCHAMRHKRIPAYSIEEIQAVIRQTQAAEQALCTASRPAGDSEKAEGPRVGRSRCAGALASLYAVLPRVTFN